MTDEKEKEAEKEQDSSSGNQKRDTARSSTSSKNGTTKPNSKQSHYSTDTQQNNKKVYFQQELKRLRSTLERQGSKIHKPQRKAYTPYTFTTLQPYYDTVIQGKVIEHEPKEPKGYVNRNTAIGLTDPWVDHTMDRDLPPKVDEKEEEPSETSASPTEEKRPARPSKTKHKKEGSTRLPKFPAVQMPTGDLASKPLNYGDVPQLRQEIKTKYGSNADKKVTDEYERTRNDFYRMDLDRLDEYHPASRGHMTQAYMAYLQNNPGSKRAIKECITEAEKEIKEIEEQYGSSRPVSAVSRHSQRPVSSRSRQSVKQE